MIFGMHSNKRDAKYSHIVRDAAHNSIVTDCKDINCSIKANHYEKKNE